MQCSGAAWPPPLPLRDRRTGTPRSLQPTRSLENSGSSSNTKETGDAAASTAPSPPTPQATMAAARRHEASHRSAPPRTGGAQRVPQATTPATPPHANKQPKAPHVAAHARGAAEPVSRQGSAHMGGRGRGRMHVGPLRKAGATARRQRAVRKPTPLNNICRVLAPCGARAGAGLPRAAPVMATPVGGGGTRHTPLQS